MGGGILGARMEAEIREQPTALRTSRAALEEKIRSLPKGGFDKVVLVARGSSDNAALYLRYLVEVYIGVPALLAAPSVLTVFGRQVKFGNALGIAISQSGESPDVRAVIADMRAQGCATLAITNSAGSPLAKEAEFHLNLRVGVEASIAATKTYTASLLSGYLLVRHFGGGLNEPALPDEEWLAASESEAGRILETLTNAKTVVSLARGFSFASAQETALKLTECALLPCRAYSTADFAHGPKALAGPELTAIVFGDAPTELGETGTTIISAPDAGSTPDAPVREIIFSQFLALFAARRQGIDPDLASNLSKVTRTY